MTASGQDRKGAVDRQASAGKAGLFHQAGGQTWSAEGYAANGRFVADLTEGVLAWLEAKPGERILDLGCGDGALTERLVLSGADVVGVDASRELLAAAEARGLRVLHRDARALGFDAEFEAVFSNAVLHWVLPPEDAVREIHAALKPGGRFVAEFGGHGNVAAIVTAMRAAARLLGGDETLAGPWFFPTPAEYTAMLEAAGFAVERCGLFARPTPLPTGLEGWLGTFRKPFFDQFDGPHRQEALAIVEALLAPSLRDREGRWTADYMRIRVSARRI
ncbi:MAG: methyltransferase domain-containing protein [Rhizobiales bacterium]|nr:methyltransferase domain-containing protein [Hyphomicrobiales bacterium]